MTARPARRRANGFTLVEVMVALMIFGMIASAGVGLLAFSVRAQGATVERLDDVGALARLSSRGPSGALYPVYVALGRVGAGFGYANEQYRNPEKN